MAEELRSFLAEATGCPPPLDLEDTHSLEVYLDGIASSLAEAQADVLSIVKERRQDVDSVLLFAEEVHTDLHDLKANLAAGIPALSSSELQTGLLQLPGLRQQLKKSSEALEVLRALNEIHCSLTGFDDSLKADDLVSANKHVQAAHQQLSEFKQQMAEAPLYAAITERCAACEQLLGAAALQCWASAWTLRASGEDQCQLELQREVGQTSVPDLLSTLQCINRSNVCLERLTDELHGGLFKRLLGRDRCFLELSELSDKQLISLQRSAVDASPAAFGGGTIARLKEACGSLEIIVDALGRFLGNANAGLPMGAAAGSSHMLTALGDSFWSRIVGLLCHDCLVATWESELNMHSPTQAAIESSLHDVTQTLAVFDACLVRSQIPQHAICAAFAVDLQFHVAVKHAQSLLSQARHLLLEPSAESILIGPGRLSHSTGDKAGDVIECKEGQQADSGSISESFKLARCRVSVRTIALVRLLREGFEFAIKCHSKAVPLMYEQTRDIIELFIAVTAGGHQIGNPIVPHTALLLSNDCLLLGHCCISLGIEYMARLNSSSSFADLAAVLRDHAMMLVEDVVSAQLQELTAIVSQGGSFSGVGENDDAHEVAKVSSKRLIHRLRALPTCWIEVAPADICLERIQELVDAPIQMWLARLQALRHISERDSAILQVLLRDVCTVCEEILSLANPNAQGKYGAATPALRQCRQIEWILGARMSEVRKHYHEHKLDMLSPHTLFQLVQAIYDQTLLYGDQNLPFMRELELLAATT
ncbi:MAG: hypothetical protein SGPRY_001175 [Prymnesium sp.]